MSAPSPEQIRRLLLGELFNSRRAVVGTFVGLSLILLAVGLVWPKNYTASTTIVVDEKNIIQPLMQGAAVTTDVTDRARLAREIIFGKLIMSQILIDAGWMKNKPSPQTQEEIIKKLTKQTRITSLAKNVIKIEYQDDNAERAYITAKRYAELFISSSLDTKATESQAAFKFIDKQVQEYHAKLQKSEEQLREYRSENVDALPDTASDIGTRMSNAQTRIEAATQELKEAEIKKKSLERQLSGEVEVASTLSRESQYRARIGELQAQLDTLRLSYHDTYPDIVRIRHQIDDLNEAIADDRKNRETAKATGKVFVDDAVINNPMYQQLKRDLSQTQVTIDTLHARIAEARRQLAGILERGKRVQGGSATLAEMTRDYQVTREIYQDLLKRRETARVSMNLDIEKQGLNFRIQEPAFLPTDPSGLRFSHFVFAAILFGTLIPIATIYLRLQLDPRIRASAMVARSKIPLLAVVPHLWPPRQVESLRMELMWMNIAVMGVLVVMILLSVLRVARVL